MPIVLKCGSLRLLEPTGFGQARTGIALLTLYRTELKLRQLVRVYTPLHSRWGCILSTLQFALDRMVTHKY